MQYLPRLLMGKVERWMERRVAVILRGARQVGKTTLLKMLQKKYGGTYIDMTDESWAERFSADPLSFAELEEPLYLDEIEMVKNAGRALKLLYDTKKPKMVVSGSGAFEVKENISGYLVGRSVSLTLYPLTFSEYVLWQSEEMYKWYERTRRKIWSYIRGQSKEFPEVPHIRKLEEYYKEYVKFGGYPAVVRMKEDKKMRLKSIIESQLERDVFRFFDVREKEKFREYLKYLAASVGGIFNVHSTGLSYQTAWNYTNILIMEYILALLKPFHKNLSTELRKSRKIYFYDIGVARLLSEERMGIGQERENFVFMQLSAGEELRYWRTQGGAEIDFVVLERGEPRIAIEVKSANKSSRALWSFLETYNLNRAVVIGNETKIEKRKHETIFLEPWWI